MTKMLHHRSIQISQELNYELSEFSLPKFSKIPKWEGVGQDPVFGRFPKICQNLRLQCSLKTIQRPAKKQDPSKQMFLEYFPIKKIKKIFYSRELDYALTIP